MGLFTKDKNFYRRFFALTFTIALQNVIVFAVNLADNVMLGAYSEPSLSGCLLYTSNKASQASNTGRLNG